MQKPERIARILRWLNAATGPEDMNLPGLRFHRLTSDQRGRYSVWVSENWRITFGWEEPDAIDVDLEDYH